MGSFMISKPVVVAFLVLFLAGLGDIFFFTALSSVEEVEEVLVLFMSSSTLEFFLVFRAMRYKWWNTLSYDGMNEWLCFNSSIFGVFEKMKNRFAFTKYTL